MQDIEELKQKLTKKFSLADADIKAPRARRVFMDIDILKFRSVLEYAFNDLSFLQLCAITGLDEGDKLAFMYSMAHYDGTMLNIKTSVPRSDPKIRTITDIFPGADVFERELVDLFGAEVEGLSPGSRYPLTDDWPQGQYPLRKDWKTLENLESGGSCRA